MSAVARNVDEFSIQNKWSRTKMVNLRKAQLILYINRDLGTALNFHKTNNCIILESLLKISYTN